MGITDYIPGVALAKALGWEDPIGDLKGATDRGQNEFRAVDPSGALAGQSAAAGAFGETGQRDFGRRGRDIDAALGKLGGIMEGKESISAEQLRQGLQQQMSGQRAMAAGARPANAAMAARTAAMNMGRASSGMAGQQALAGIQERQAAANSYAQLAGLARGQDLQAALGGRGQAIQGYGDIERARAGRFQSLTQSPTGTESLIGAGMGIGSLMAMSDRRLKTDIADGDDDAKAFLKGLKAYRFKYTDAKHGDGDQLGIMAQDLEKTRLGKQAIVETGEGKAINGAKLATALAAAAASMDRRLSKLESKKG